MQQRGTFNWMNMFLIFIFMIGLSILLYPNISDYVNQRNSSKAVSEYDESIAKLNQEQRQASLESANSYNSRLSTNMSRFTDMTEDEYEEYMGELNINGEGMMCYLKIDKLGVNLPVYHGTDESVLQHYVGHVEGTSLPTGGIGTHCGLSGHRGLPTAVLFTNLDRMEVGDTFEIYVLGEVHQYVVDQIVFVLPDDLSPLEIDPNEDYVTLITCHPYGVNTHRMMVRGKRVPDGMNAEDLVEAEDGDKNKKLFDFTREQLVNGIAITMTGGFFFIGIPLFILIPVRKRIMVLRPWDDNIVEVIDAAVIVSAYATRENWEVSEVAKEADWLASLRRWDESMGSVDAPLEKEEGPQDILDVAHELYSLEEEEFVPELMKLDGVPEGMDVYELLEELKEQDMLDESEQMQDFEGKEKEQVPDIEDEKKDTDQNTDIENEEKQIPSHEEELDQNTDSYDEDEESDSENTEKVLTEEEQELYDSITEEVNGRKFRDESLLYDKLLITGKYEERPWDDFQYEEDILQKTVKKASKEKEEAEDTKTGKKAKKKKSSANEDKSTKDKNTVDKKAANKKPLNKKSANMNGKDGKPEEEEKEEEYLWDNDILDKVDQDWGKLDPEVQKVALPFIDIKKVLEDKKYGTADQEDKKE